MKVKVIELEAMIQYTEPMWITAKDIKNLKKGDKLTLISLNRNIYDQIDDNKPYVAYNAAILFKPLKCFYIHEKDSKGYMFWSWDIETKHDFEWELEYKAKHWYPIENGVFPANDTQILELFGKKDPLLGYELNWENVPNSMHLGFRGPMLQWKYVSKLPYVYYKDN
jgi:hypothetical protein